MIANPYLIVPTPGAPSLRDLTIVLQLHLAIRVPELLSSSNENEMSVRMIARLSGLKDAEANVANA